jgi:hypothetical protein
MFRSSYLTLFDMAKKLAAYGGSSKSICGYLWANAHKYPQNFFLRRATGAVYSPKNTAFSRVEKLSGS